MLDELERVGDELERCVCVSWK